MLRQLKKYSSKYAATIQNIMEAWKNNETVFVYCEFVKGSGIIILAKLLELFGYNLATGREGVGSEKQRFIVISNITSSQTEMKSLINRFNQTDNMFGKIIQVVIGSRVIGEGFSLSNIQNENILTPHWNYSETSQAIARGYRFGSHRDLVAAGIKPVVKVYQRVSIPSNNTPSIDMLMYEISEKKDIVIKRIERVVKEAAFDCSLNYNRNKIEGYDNERECEYGSCNYTCDGVPMEIIEGGNIETDPSTYRLYYNDEAVKDIIKNVTELLKTTFKISLEDLVIAFPENSLFEILTAMRRMIGNSIIIYNKYGFPSYLKEEGNEYFLVDSLTSPGNFFAEYYTHNIMIKNTISLASLIEKKRTERLPLLIQDLFKSRTKDELKTYVIQIPLNIQEFIIENSI
jgi:hypothetical protein